MPSAEQAYLFRHALLRDAAYQLQLPGDRARLHELAFELIEQLAGGRPGPLPPLDSETDFVPHSIDHFSIELSEHAKGAATRDGQSEPAWHDLRHYYLRRAAYSAALHYRMEDAANLWLTLANECPPQDRGEYLRRAGDTRHRGGLGGEIEAHYSAAIDCSVVISNGACECLARVNLGLFCLETGRAKIALSMLEQGLAGARRLGLERVETAALGNLAKALQQLGEVERAEAILRECLASARRTANRNIERVVLGSLALNLGRTGRTEEARAYFEQALAMPGDPRSRGGLLHNYADFLLNSGRPEQAEPLFKEALAILRETGNRRGEGAALADLGVLYALTGRAEMAEDNYLRAIALHQEVRNLRAEGVTLGALALVYFSSGEILKAEAMMRRSLELSRLTGSRRDEAVALGNLAGIVEHQDKIGEAEQLYARAIELHILVRNLQFEGAHRCAHALLKLRMGHVAKARDDWNHGVSQLHLSGDVDEIPRARDAMKLACAKAGVPPFDEPAIS